MGHVHMNAENLRIITDKFIITSEDARVIANAYAWSWATCWFAETGEFNHFLMEEGAARHGGSFAKSMDHGLFGWWMDHENATRDAVDVRLRDLMWVYLNARELDGNMGQIWG